MGEKIKIDEKWDSLSKKAAMARNAGMTYGKYVGALYEQEQREKQRSAPGRGNLSRKRNTCKSCGGFIPAGRATSEFCCRECEDDYHAQILKMQRKNSESSRAEPERRCVHCGKIITNGRKLYCTDTCKYLHNQRKAEQKREKRLCKQCGKEIAKAGRRLYCCDICADIANIQKKRQAREKRIAKAREQISSEAGDEGGE